MCHVFLRLGWLRFPPSGTDLRNFPRSRHWEGALDCYSAGDKGASCQGSHQSRPGPHVARPAAGAAWLQLPAQPGTSPPASATLHHVQTLGLSSSSSCGGGSNARWPGEAGPAGASGTRPGDSQARLAAMQPSADAGASAPAVGAPVEEFDSAPAAAKPSPAPMAFIRAARPCALPRQLAVTNAPATSAMAIPVKRAHPPARPGGSNAGTSHGSVDSSSAGPALSGADGSSGGDSTAGRAGGSARPLPDWQEQRGWRRRNRGDGRKPMQVSGVLAGWWGARHCGG